jgi:hypothetical protein
MKAIVHKKLTIKKGIPYQKGIKSGIFGQPEAKVYLGQAWRIEFPERNIHEYYARSKGRARNIREYFYTEIPFSAPAHVGLRVFCAYRKKCRINSGSKSSDWPNVSVLIFQSNFRGNCMGKAGLSLYTDPLDVRDLSCR